jgi:hypothetical protein
MAIPPCGSNDQRAASPSSAASYIGKCPDNSKSQVRDPHISGSYCH